MGRKKKAPEPVVYGLVDPRTGALRYVGKTIDASKRREAHMRGSGHGHRANWIKGLHRENLLPVFCVLEACSTVDAYQAEQEWISMARAWGADLTNHDDGGPGRTGAKASLETRKKLSESHKGHRIPIDVRAKMSLAHMGLPKPKKLTAQQAQEIRQSTLSSRKIAPLYGITDGVVRQIRRGVIWRASHGA